MEVDSGAVQNCGCHTLSPSNVPQKPKVVDRYSYVGGSSNILSGKLVKRDVPLGKDDKRCTDLPERHPAMSQMRSLAEASSSDSVPHNASHFAGAHDFVSYGGTYTNILGNYTVFGETKDLDPDRSLEGIIPGFPVLHRKDVIPEYEIYKGPGYRFHSAQGSGRVVALKVYEGSHAKERCSKAARFYQGVIHPNIPHLTAVSPFASKCSFLVFDGEYEGTVDYILGQIIQKGLEQILILGLQIVIGLSSGLNYLQDQKYPFKSIGLEHFVLLNSRGRIMISFDPEELPDQSTRPNEQSSEDETDDDKDVLHIFNGLCTKTFDAARKAHYQNDQIQSKFFDDDDDGVPYDDVLEDELKLSSDAQENFGATQSAPKLASKPVLKQRPNGRRQELVWRPPAHENIILSEISRDFKYFLNVNRSSLEPALIRRRGRYTARTPHRCPGYNRIEITLTPNITRSAIVTHSSPTLHEICPVCREVVKGTEIFNCICGNDNDESVPTVRCSKCFEWHHRPCVHYFDLDPHKFICANCLSDRDKATKKTRGRESSGYHSHPDEIALVFDTMLRILTASVDIERSSKLKGHSYLSTTLDRVSALSRFLWEEVLRLPLAGISPIQKPLTIYELILVDIQKILSPSGGHLWISDSDTSTINCRLDDFQLQLQEALDFIDQQGSPNSTHFFQNSHHIIISGGNFATSTWDPVKFQFYKAPKLISELQRLNILLFSTFSAFFIFHLVAS